MKKIYLNFASEYQNIPDPVLATVIRTTGSTPQKEGSSALFSTSGLFAGTIGGGVLEGKVGELALKACKSKISGYYTFMLDNSHVEGEDALCGGSADVLIDANPVSHIEVFKSIRKSLADGISGALVTMISGMEDDNISINRIWLATDHDNWLKCGISEFLFQQVRYIIGKNDPYGCSFIEQYETENEPHTKVFIEPVFPQPKLIIAGAGHVGKALAFLGQMLDFDITIIDDRPEFANKDNIPYADRFIVDDPGKALSGIEKTPDSYFVIVTRGHKDDANALRPCIGSGAAYVGMIGSRPKVAKMKDEFISKGWATEHQWAGIYAPIGLDIGSQTVEEIAVSIAAQLVDVRNRTNKAHD